MAEDQAGVQFELSSRKHGLSAEAAEIDGEFIVRAGSQARSQWTGEKGHSYESLHNQLVTQKVLVPATDGNFRFARDYAFRKPSAAAAVIQGRAANGRNDWRVKGTQKTYAQWQEEQLAQVPTSGADE